MTEVLTEVLLPATRPDIRICLDAVTEHNVKQFKKINISILPVQYNDTFYKQVVASEIHCCQLAYFNDLVVGGMCFRLEDSSESEIGVNRGKQTEADIKNVVDAPRKRLYIMTLGTLTPYRNYGVGSELLKFIIQRAKDYGDVDGIYLHVQTNNEAAKNFYEKHNFQVENDGQIIKDYYARVEPRDAFLLSYKIEASDIKKVKLSENIQTVSNAYDREKDKSRIKEALEQSNKTGAQRSEKRKSSKDRSGDGESVAQAPQQQAGNKKNKKKKKGRK